MKLLKAPLYAVTEEWEHDGYDDSDCYRVVFDPNTRTLSRFETGSTRYASARTPGAPFVVDVPERVVSDAERVFAGLIFDTLRLAEHADILEPRAVKHGDRLRTTRAIRGKSACPAGTAGEVFRSGSYGTFYRNGHNRPGRENTRVGLRLRDGSKVFVALSACRRDREPDTDDALRCRAVELARHRNFYALFRTSSVFF